MAKKIYYISFKTHKKENRKIKKFTKKKRLQFNKALSKLAKKFDKATSKFVKKHQGFYINDFFFEDFHDICFRNIMEESQKIYDKKYCFPREIASIDELGKLNFACDLFPDGYCTSTWQELKLKLQSLDSATYHITDSDGNKYPYKYFVKIIESKLYDIQ